MSREWSGEGAILKGNYRAEMPFPGTESFADAEFLIGGNRPTPAIRRTAIEWHIFLGIGRSVMIDFMVSTRSSAISGSFV
jgi:hypothetical protein